MSSETLPAPGSEPEVKAPVASTELNTPPDQAAKPVESAEVANLDAENTEEPAKKPKQSVSERIGQIHAQKKQAEADRDFALATARRLQADLDKLKQQPIDHLPYDQQDSARLTNVVKAERLQEKIAEAQEKHAHVEQMMAQQYQAKLEAARERIPTLPAAMQALNAVPIGQAAAEIVIESDKAAEITNWLGTHLDEAWKIAALPPHRQAAEIARIEARLNNGPSPRRHSNAPPPPTTITGASSPAAKDPANMSMDEYAKWRAKA